MERSAQNSKSKRDENESENEHVYSNSQLQDENGDWYDIGEDSDVSASTWSNKSHYTDIRRIDLGNQAQGNWNYRHGQLYYLGSIWDLGSLGMNAISAGDSGVKLERIQRS